MKQLSMSFLQNYRKNFGGSLLVGRRKEMRPLSTTNPIHLVLKCDLKSAFNPGNRKLEQLIRRIAQKLHVRIFDMALNWSHIHCVILIKDRKLYHAFIRTLTSRLAISIRKHKHWTGTVFSLRPFTRVLSWGRDFKNALSYQVLNKLESFGLIIRNKRPKKSPA